MKCKFEHDGDCCNSGAKQYMCKCKKPCDTIIPITNADRIRAMSDEELANIMAGTPICKERYMDCLKDGRDCEPCLLEWLKQPAEE